MLGLRDLLPELAATETRAVTPVGHEGLPERAFLLLESYCTERGCDCRRVILSIMDVERREQVATVNYAFEAPTGRDADLGQIFLDPINPQSEMSGPLFDLISEMLESDGGYRDALERHYRKFKEVVEDPGHPGQAVIHRVEGVASRPRAGAAPLRRRPSSSPATIRSARRPFEMVRRATPKVGANDPCPCGSGEKFKRCCR